MPIIQFQLIGSAILRRKPSPIEEITKEHKDVIAQMKHILKDMFPMAVGLAAQQIGHLYPIFVVNLNKDELDGNEEACRNLSFPLAFINPSVHSLEGEQIGPEGCISLMGTYYNKKRAMSCVVDYQDENGNKKTLKAEGLLARVIQHEYDHLQGTLFTDDLDIEKDRV